MVVRIENGFRDNKMEKKFKKKKPKKAVKIEKSPQQSPKSSPTTKVTGQVPIMEGMSASETKMIRRLAGNDPLVRKKTVKKLRKWLNAVAQRTPDTPGCRDVVEPNTVRVWKALFYCMWMADKPLPQEQLAENISDLVSVFASKPNALLVFVEWFFRTMAREWSWIDRLRLDKFMMLVRRFLRKTLSVLAEQKWKAETTEGVIKILKVYVFNHHPQVKVKKGEAQAPTVTCPVGFQIHIIDIFLEEVAKVDADGLKSPKVLKLLSPFIHELAMNDDERILDEIRERVFHHLMRQSDVGMDYQDALMYGVYGDMEPDESEDEDVEDDNKETDENEDDEDLEAQAEGNSDNEQQKDDEEMDAEDEEADKGPLDPRAGAVDVILPQLEIDYNTLAEKLTEAGGQKIVKKKNRGLLYTLATQFREIVQGKYPLALPQEERQKPIITQKAIKKATNRLVLDADSGLSKIRKNKKQRRRDAKKAVAESLASNDSFGSEDASTFLTDGELMEHVSDNYVSYVHEQMEDDESQDDEDDESQDDEDDESQDDEDDESQDDEEDSENEELDEVPVVTVSKGKNRQKNEKKSKGKKYKTVIEVEADEIDGEEGMAMDTADLINGGGEIIQLIRTPKSGKNNNKARQSDPLRQIMKVTPMKAKVKQNTTPVHVVQVQTSPKNSNSSKKKLTPKSINNIVTMSSKAGCITPLSSKLKGKMGVNRSTPGSTGGGSGSGLKKRVSFVLARNKEHEATDYMGSIQSSPAIPFDGNRTPNYGLLKAANSTSSSPMFQVSSPRKRALDFF